MTALWMLGEDLAAMMAEYDRIVEDATISEEEKEDRITSLFGVMVEMGDEFDAKAENVARYIKELEAREEACRKEAQRVTNLARDAANKAERLERYLIRNMEISGRQKIDGKFVKLSVAKKPDELEIGLEELVPTEFMRVKYEAQKAEIKKYLKDIEGHACEWARLVPSKQKSLRIK